MAYIEITCKSDYAAMKHLDRAYEADHTSVLGISRAGKYVAGNILTATHDRPNKVVRVQSNVLSATEIRNWMDTD